MEDMVEATALAINYDGEAVLESRTAALLQMVLGVEAAADDAGVPHDALARAAAALQLADADGRPRALVDLRLASTELGQAAVAPLLSLRRAAAELARACEGYQAAVDAMSRVQRAKDEPVQPTEEGRPAGSWWSKIWGPRRGHRGLPAAEQQGSGALKVDAVMVSIEFLSGGVVQFQQKAAQLVSQARKLVSAAKEADVPSDDLLEATDKLELAGDAGRLPAVIALCTVAVALERSDNARRADVRDRATDLARACHEIEQAADAMATVQRAAVEQRERRVAGGWWSSLRGKRRGNGRLQDGGSAVAPPPCTLPVQSNEKSSGCSAMQGTALLGSLTMLPYMGPDAVLKTEVYSKFYRACVGIGFSSLWCVVGAGVPCL